MSAKQFARGLSHDTVVHIYLVQPVNGTVGLRVVGELHYTHWAAHGSETIGVKMVESEQLLDSLERDFPEVFVEPTYPIVKRRDPFQIKLLNELV